MDESLPSTRTTCPYCGVGCGVIATPQPDGSVAIKGDPEHPANFGRLCSKGSALGETLSLDDRLLYPEVLGERATWDAALDLVADRFSKTIRDFGPESVALYVSGQILTEDYYVANKLVKGYFGTGNIDTNSRLCMASSVAGHRRAFGTDTVPGTYEDLEEADLVVLVGSNLAWCHPVVFQRLLAAREKRDVKIVVVDPRRTMTAQAADLHLALKPDSDVALFLGLLKHLDDGGFADAAYLARHVGDAAPARAAAHGFDMAKVAAETGLSEADLAEFYAAFARTSRVVTLYSQGVNMSVYGSDKVNAIINCHLLTGRIGRVGMGPFSMTGQPNAMGGREVGGLANMLAAHMNIEDEIARERVQRFWNSPRIAERPGLKAVDLFQAVKSGQVKAVWIMGTNPVDSLPDADDVAAALAACPLVVVSDCIRETDTTRYAHVLLPALGWGEKSGTVTNSERRISRQRGFIPAPGEAKADWWAICEVAKKMGFAGFDFANASAIYAEHAALSGFENGGARDFDIGAHAAIAQEDYEALEPFQWPMKAGETPKITRFFADGGFYTPDRKARMIATPLRDAPKTLSEAHPLWLNTGRIRDHWHTMTRTAKSARLNGHYGEPFCEIHPEDAVIFDIKAADLLEVETAFGKAVLRVLVTDRQQPGSIFVPMHWTDQYAAKGRVNALVNPANDPVSGQPGSKATPASIRPFAANWYGFAVSAKAVKPKNLPYWALAKADFGFRLELAGNLPISDWQSFANDLFDVSNDIEWVAYYDETAGTARLAAFDADRLIGALFVAPEPVALARGFLTDELGVSHTGQSRLKLLAGRGGADRPDAGAIICACFSVGINQITAAIREGHASVNAIGEALKAGTNCGSCRSEIRRVIDENRFEKAV